MNPETQRIAIAEACGWKRGKDAVSGGEIWPVWNKGSQCGSLKTQTLPDYLNDLNAMHEAEKVLAGNHALIYLNFLAEVVNWRSDEISPEGYTCHTHELFKFATATTAQRAEAFLNTLGLWKDV